MIYLLHKLKKVGFDGKVPDRDLFVAYNNMMLESFGEHGYKYSEVSSSIPVKVGNFLEKGGKLFK